MKKVYVKPSVDMVSFQCEDIITVSSSETLTTTINGVEAASVGAIKVSEGVVDIFS